MSRSKRSEPPFLRFDRLTGDPRLTHFFTVRSNPYDLIDPGERQAFLHTFYGGNYEIVVPRQVHGDQIAVVSGPLVSAPEADALVTAWPGLFIGILVADCFPILLFDPHHLVLAVVHAGWRGVAANIQGKTVEFLRTRFASQPSGITAVIGPGIGPCCFQVGEEVVHIFHKHGGFQADWLVKREGKFFLNLRFVIVTDLIRQGVPAESIETVLLCTACRRDLFHSYRRDGPGAGRMLLGAALCPDVPLP
ncbi:MAG TPA: peptidoglycan editing factor PgeF [Atribacteraceae bacterium]|nr:peptidoglycan editing factor PgeF [Atribacteraceae bacterium]